MENLGTSRNGQSRFRFGEFELDRKTRVLWRDGRITPLQQQPLQILELLLMRAGEVVTRDEIRQAVWPNDSYGKFDAGVGNAIRKIRVALDDDAENARFLKTLPRQGFRFIAPVLLVSPQKVEPDGPAPKMTHRGGKKASIVVLAALLLAGLIFAWTAARVQAPTLQGSRPLVALGGRPTHPSFSPNGEMLAFDWSGPDDDHPAIYMQRLEATSPMRLTSGKQLNIWPVWSPDGTQIAFLREKRPDRMEVIVNLLAGKGEWTLFEVQKAPADRPRLDWSPDGKWLATAERMEAAAASTIVLYSLKTGEKWSVTHPPADWRGDSEPVFSPDSKEIAFRRTRPASGNEDIFRVRVSGGEPQAVTEDHSGVAALVYTPDHGILFSSRRGGSLRSLWWSSPNGGAPKLISDPAFDLGSPAISRNGRHLAYVKVLNDVNLWRLPVAGGQPEAVSPSEFVEQNPAFSPDGNDIVFVSSRTGRFQIWTAAANGAAAVQLTFGPDLVAVPQWSPDGKRIAYEWRPKGHEGIYTMASSGSKPQAVVTGKSRNSVPRWSHDARFLYFNSNRSGRQEIWQVPAEGGQPIQVTKNGACGAVQSADGSALYYAKPEVHGIWVSPLRNGLPDRPERLVLGDLDVADCGNWALGREGIYYVRRDKVSTTRGSIVFFRFDTGLTSVIHVMRSPPLFQGFGLALSPDQTTLLFAQVDTDGTSIYGR